MDSPEQERTSNRDLQAALQNVLFLCHSSGQLLGLQDQVVLEFAPLNPGSAACWMSFRPEVSSG